MANILRLFFAMVICVKGPFVRVPRILKDEKNIHVSAISCVFSIRCFPLAIGEFMLRPTRLAVHDLFSQERIIVSDLDEFRCASQNAPETCFNFDWQTSIGAYGNLTLFIIVNMVFTLAAVTLNWPCGLFSVRLLFFMCISSAVCEREMNSNAWPFQSHVCTFFNKYC